MFQLVATHFVVVLFLVLFSIIQISHTHVGLTFPPARKFDLDFLDNVRTKPPCGMPKGSIRTTLVSGSTVNITWHLSYPHQGGYRLELMDSSEKQVLDLTPRKGTDEYIRGDPTAQAYQVKLPPSFTCTDCTIRLLREASEWSGKYRFWSCADVSIIELDNYKETCSGQGRPIVGRCLCHKGFWGHRCQYENECDSDKECGHGKCIDLGGTALPRKQCFCILGFHGEKCAKRNAVRLPDSSKPLDLKHHTKRILSDRFNLYYKIIPGKQPENKELEFVLEIEGTSYGAIGWRPGSFGKSCQRWPFIANSSNAGGDRSANGKGISLIGSSSNQNTEGAAAEPEPKPEGEPEPKPEGEPEPKPEGEPEPTAEAEPTSDLKPETSEPKPEGEPSPQSEPEPAAEPEVETTTKSLPKSNSAKLKSKLRPKPTLVEDDGGQDVNLESSAITVTRNSPKRQKRSPMPESSHPEPEPEGEPQAEPQPEGEPTPTSASEPEPAPESATPSHDYKPSDLQPHEWAPKADFHAMDCIDLVMGAAKGSVSRILDYYTRDRSTPRLDSFWGGKNDITSAVGWEKDGKTILIFRRKVRSAEGSDHSLDGGEMHVIWARGQEPGGYVHKPKSGLEAEDHMPSVPSFYAADEIKYHGHGAQRGKTRIDFMESSGSGSKSITKNIANCEESWSHPPGCTNEGTSNPCTYLAKWNYIPSIDSVHFTVESRKAEKWTGIGFGDSPSMRNSDTVLGWVTAGGRFFLMDAFMSSYVAPSLDSVQNIKNETGSYADGLVSLSFIRPVISTDPKDVSLDKCRFFLFPIEGGTYDPVSKKIGKHEQTPLTSAERVCISRTCRPVIPKKPDEIRYAFDIKLIGGFAKGWNPPRKGTSEFDEFSNRLRRDLEPKLKQLNGFHRLQLTDVNKQGTEAVAKLELMVQPNSELSDMERVKQALKDTISSGKAGSLQLDPTYLELSAPEIFHVNKEEDEASNENGEGLYPGLIGTRLWIVIGCVSALIALAILQAILTIYKAKTKASSHKDTPSSGSGLAWKDYSETNYGYEGYDEKYPNGGGNGNVIPLRTTPTHYGGGPNYQQYSNNGNSSHITNLSLPRPQSSQTRPGGRNPQMQDHRISNSHLSAHPSTLNNGHSNGGGHRGGSGPSLSQTNPADFYFMPSQRKYSGEVVRVYVDHNNKR